MRKIAILALIGAALLLFRKKTETDAQKAQAGALLQMGRDIGKKGLVPLNAKAPGVAVPTPISEVIQSVKKDIASGGIFKVVPPATAPERTYSIMPIFPPEPIAVLSAGPTENKTTKTILGSGQTVSAFQPAPTTQLRLLDGSYALGVSPLTAKNVALEQLRRVRAGESGTVDSSLSGQLSRWENYVNSLPYNLSADDLYKTLAFAGIGYDTGVLLSGLRRAGLM